MRVPVWYCLFGCLILSNTGCLAKQFVRDGKSSHEAVADDYTEQAMTNLILAKRNLPFVQLKYYQLSVSDQDHFNVGLSVKQTVTTKRNLFVAAATRSLDNLSSVNASADRTRTLSLIADPITTQNDIYERYLAFAQNSDLFCVSDRPPSCPVHILRKHEHSYYWVPCHAGQAFMDLVLYVSQMRAPEQARPVQTPYDVRIVQVLNYEQIQNRDIANATLVFDKTVPNGEATMIVELDRGRKVQMSLWPVSKDAQGKALRLGEPTVRLEAQWSPKKDALTANQMARRTARVYSHDYPQEAPVPDPVIRQIANDINQIRINVLLGNR